MAHQAAVVDGRALAKEMLAEVASRLEVVRARVGQLPELRVVITGADPASAIYARGILKGAAGIGLRGAIVEVEAETAAVRKVLRSLSDDREVGGVILQLPLPAGLRVQDVILELDPGKDLDGIHPFNAGLVARGEGGFAPSCAEAAVTILKRAGVPMAGRRAAVVGRSNVVGKAAGLLLIREHATVTVCHRQTRDLRSHLQEAEIVVAAAGSPGLIHGADIRPGAALVDCGISVLADGSVRGDVDLESVLDVASVVTPVPGGVGPVTNAVLLDHFARAVGADHVDGSPPGDRERGP